jgi:hypothetical protein
MKSTTYFAALFLALFCAFFPPELRSQGTQGTILGSVTDASGGSVPGAKVTIRNEGTNFVREITSDESGDYRVAGLEPGFYEVTVASAGFKTFKQTRVDIVSNQIKRVNANWL